MRKSDPTELCGQCDGWEQVQQLKLELEKEEAEVDSWTGGAWLGDKKTRSAAKFGHTDVPFYLKAQLEYGSVLILRPMETTYRGKAKGGRYYAVDTVFAGSVQGVTVGPYRYFISVVRRPGGLLVEWRPIEQG